MKREKIKISKAAYKQAKGVRVMMEDTYLKLGELNLSYERSRKILLCADEMFKFITEIQQALTDKSKYGTKLSVLEFSMLNQANEILNQIKK